MSWKNYFQRNELSRLASHKGVISLREPQKGVISRKGTMLQSQTQEDLEANLATPWVGG